MNRSLVVTAGSLLLMASVAACGTQTDERVSSSAAPASSTPAIASEPPMSAAPSSAASEVAAATPFVTVDCVSGQVMPTDAPPAGTTVGPVTAIFGPSGIPAITVATDATPATELQTADITEGSGPAVVAGDTITVDYCGVGLGGKTLFDSSWASGQPATFALTGLIQGWQDGLPGMKVGGQRLLIIPGSQAYGQNPPPGIQPDETLIFVIQLSKIG